MDSSYITLCLLNAFLSYTTAMLNIVTIHAIRKTPSLSKGLKALLLNLAVSDLGVGLIAQPLYVAKLIIDSKENNETSKPHTAFYIACLITTNVFSSATIFVVMVLCADRFVAIHFYLRYQELVTYKRIVAVVASIWVFSGLLSLMRILISKNIMYVVFGIIMTACVIAATFFSVRIYFSVRRHVNQIQVQQLQQASQNGQMAGVARLRKVAIMAVYICLVLQVCYLPHIYSAFAVAFTSVSNTAVEHLHYYTLTLFFLNSSLNPLIYCWKIKHVRHRIIGLLRNAFSSQT